MPDYTRASAAPAAASTATYNRPPALAPMKLLRRPLVLLALVATAAPAPARAQFLPSSPLVLGDGRLVVGGDMTMTVGERDEIGWFNYTDYERNALRLFRISVAGEWRLWPRLTVLAEVQSENVEDLRLSAAYARFRLRRDWPIDVQIGRIPPTFGSFGRRVYGPGNPLIGHPLAYQYLTSLRADALPATPDDLLRMRARGWLSSFPLGSATPTPGLPVVSGFRWDTGVQVRVSGARAELAAAVTNGSLSNPRVRDNNGGKQVVARVQVQPLFGLLLGASGARGAWLDDDVVTVVPGSPDRRLTQRAVGLDAEYSRDHWIVRAEMVHSAWRLPVLTVPPGTEDLRATSMALEGRYRLGPRFFVAARVDRLGFSRITGTLYGGVPTPWDAPMVRAEAGGGWYLQRNLVARATWQGNWREDGRQRERRFVSAQLSYWF